MSTALYRRYRPETFTEVIGQDHVTGPLMQALRSDRVHHAYLFSGPRGCGKTTSARILARCLNCAQGPTDTPCGVCDSCVQLARGGSGSLDVVEIDAASHGGVDDARELRERATFAPARDKFKIFIIDEAHMVTPQGFNALLKIVEEPPEHVKFVFATTEPDKVIGTIRSRTHHYPFHLVPPERLLGYLEELSQAERVPVGKGVLPLVVRAGAGSVRDSLSVLDQLMAGADDSGVDYERAIALLGYTHASLLDDVVTAVSAGDGAAVFGVVERVIDSGHDPRRFVEDLLERLRDLIVLQAVGDAAPAVFRALPEDQLDRMRHQAATFRPATLSRSADLANTALTEMTGATSPRLHLELLCARILLPGAEHTERGLAARLDRIERRLSVPQGPVAEPLPPVVEPTRPAEPAARTDGEESPASDAVPAPPETTPPGLSATAAEPDVDPAPEGAATTEGLRRMWPDVMGRLQTVKRFTWSLVSQQAQVVEYSDGVLTVGFSSQGLVDRFRAGSNADFLRQAVIDVLGVDARVEAVVTGGPSAAPAVVHEEPQPTREPARPTSRRVVPPDPTTVDPADDVARRDDPDAEDAGLVGTQVVEQMLGGRVIDEGSGAR